MLLKKLILTISIFICLPLCEANSKTPHVMQSNLINLSDSNNYEYKDVCIVDNANKPVSDDKNEYECIKFFKETVPANVQMRQAVELAKLYLVRRASRYNDNISESEFKELYNKTECSTFWYEDLSDEYIKCAITVGQKKLIYDFQFDDTTERFDNTIIKSVNRSVCKILGKETDNSYKYCLGVNCDFLNMYLSVFGYTSEKIILPASAYSCAFGGGVINDANTLVNDLKDWGVNADVFQHLQMSDGTFIEFFLRRYIERRIVAKDRNFDFAKLKYKCSKGTIILTKQKGDDDDVVSCIVTDETQKLCNKNDCQVDFIFDDLSNISLTGYDDGVAGSAMACLRFNGEYAGKSCAGLEKGQCEQLKQHVTKGACSVSWNKTLEICELTNCDSNLLPPCIENVGTIVSAGTSGYGLVKGRGGKVSLISAALLFGGMFDMCLSQLMQTDTINRIINQTETCRKDLNNYEQLQKLEKNKQDELRTQFNTNCAVAVLNQLEGIDYKNYSSLSPNLKTALQTSIKDLINMIDPSSREKIFYVNFEKREFIGADPVVTISKIGERAMFAASLIGLTGSGLALKKTGFTKVQQKIIEAITYPIEKQSGKVFLKIGDLVIENKDLVVSGANTASNTVMSVGLGVKNMSTGDSYSEAYNALPESTKLKLSAYEDSPF